MGVLSFLGLRRKSSLLDQRLRSLDGEYLILRRQMEALESGGPGGESRTGPIRRGSVREGRAPAPRSVRPVQARGKSKASIGRGDSAVPPQGGGRPRPRPGGGKHQRRIAEFYVPDSDTSKISHDAMVVIRGNPSPIDLEREIRSRRTQATWLAFLALILVVLALALWFGDWSGVRS